MTTVLYLGAPVCEHVSPLICNPCEVLKCHEIRPLAEVGRHYKTYAQVLVSSFNMMQITWKSAYLLVYSQMMTKDIQQICCSIIM